jgi:hypothetical protein
MSVNDYEALPVATDLDQSSLSAKSDVPLRTADVLVATNYYDGEG